MSPGWLFRNNRAERWGSATLLVGALEKNIFNPRTLVRTRGTRQGLSVMTYICYFMIMVTVPELVTRCVWDGVLGLVCVD